MNQLDMTAALSFVEASWEASIVPALKQYITIPNKSPAFDAQWKQNGHMDRAVQLIASWCEKRSIPGLQLQVVQLHNERGEPRTPVIFMEIPGIGAETVLLYGHLDKQPEMVGWQDGLYPDPVRRMRTITSPPPASVTV